MAEVTLERIMREALTEAVDLLEHGTSNELDQTLRRGWLDRRQALLDLLGEAGLR